ncbi:DUF397 domain-containing protein [Micromonospora sp. NPDC049836]|uniref:DUF397 domain-containing protein n=1 Tax=Micromonospora sp. NPDC049836 TaxID=3364274 RepID=UPI003797589C
METSDHLVWRKSSRSDNNGGACVEVAFTGSGVLVRDSKDRSGPTLHVEGPAWAAFLAGLSIGQRASAPDVVASP